MSHDVARAYSDTGHEWQGGPGRIYDRLADVLLEGCPIELNGARVLDIGAGTGAATRAAARRGAQPVAVDVALGMLLAGGVVRPPSVLGDARALPFAEGTFDAVVAAFSLNHLRDPATALREAARVMRDGGAIVASAYADDDKHPVKEATERAAAGRGWVAPAWIDELRADAMPRLATVERAEAVAAEAGLQRTTVQARRVAFPDLGPAELVAWRLGMAQLAPFVATLSPRDRIALAADASAALGADPPVLERSMIVLVSRG